MKTELFPVPTWALNYLVNGSEDTLEFGEKDMIEDWREKNGILDVFCPDDADNDSYFTHRPPFGLACNVVDCECVLEW